MILAFQVTESRDQEHPLGQSADLQGKSRC